MAQIHPIPSDTRFQDLNGQVFGKLTILFYAGRGSGKNSLWHCRCQCGAERTVAGPQLTRGDAKACIPCQKAAPRPKRRSDFEDLSGQIFGRLTVIKLNRRENNVTFFDCLCSCGNTHTVRAPSLKAGTCTSCGCRVPVEKPTHETCRACQRLLPFDAIHFIACSQHRFGLRVRCRECVQPVINARLRARSKRLRMEVLTHYSGPIPSCACCGESGLPFLAIDHIDGLADDEKRMTGERWYSWLKRNNFPTGFRVLCHNCNSCFGKYGYCVHNPPEGVTVHYPKPVGRTWQEPAIPESREGVWKECIRCRRNLPRTVEFFYKHPQMASGLLGSCKNCCMVDNLKIAPAKRKERRNIVLSHYSGGSLLCECCHESLFEFLTIDHIGGGGAAHRKLVSNLDLWLIGENFPSGFRVLCHNCNFADGIYGSCPHSEKTV